jgi:Ankyrin repeats (3 copies)/Ankyrin repeat
MAWDRLKQFLGRQEENASQIPDVCWIEADDNTNTWGVRVLDVRPVTLTMLSTSTDPQCASNASSFGQDDGTSFIGEEPPVRRIVDASLRFPIDRILADGVLFAPTEMEHKWALFYHGRQIICVRSWLRKVMVIACVEQRQDHVEITQVRGTFGADDEEPQFTIRVLDYLLRSHALGTVYPTPLPAGTEADPKAAAMWCMSMFGNRALIATPYRFDRHDPDRPLRTHSLLHIAVAQGNMSAIERHLAAGVPLDLLAGDGCAPLHWALVPDDPAIMSLLLDRGSSVDVRSAEGATPLMNAVEIGSVDKLCFLLDHGAEVDARDRRGFTALHRAAEIGLLEALRVLLDRGAAPNIAAEGHTPRSLAEGRGNEEIVAILNEYISAAS